VVTPLSPGGSRRRASIGSYLGFAPEHGDLAQAIAAEAARPRTTPSRPPRNYNDES